ncbi:MAG: hypothetical protein ACI9QD_000017 [Thermoproteota archaeon]|jgi:hypothetical protein
MKVSAPLALVKFLLLMMFSTSVNAITFEDGSFPELITSARALAMGNAFISKTDDAWATFYNPAGLGTVRKVSTRFNMHMELNKGFMDVTSGDSWSDVPGNLVDALTVSGVRSLLAAKPGNVVHTRLNLYPNITGRHFSAGFMYSQRNRAYLASTTSNLEVVERRDYGPVGAFNLSLFGGIVKIGSSLVWLVRKDLEKEITPSGSSTVTDAEYGTGTMLYYTVGLKITAPFWGLPTLSAVVRNASEDTFTQAGSGGDAPDDVARTVDIGVSFTPQIGRAARFHFEVNAKDVSNKSNTDDSRRLTAGFEFDYKRVMYVRFGWGDGFGSFGLGVRSKHITMDMSTYAVDTTSGAYRGNEDRRFVLSVSSGY